MENKNVGDIKIKSLSATRSDARRPRILNNKFK